VAWVVAAKAKPEVACFLVWRVTGKAAEEAWGLRNRLNANIGEGCTPMHNWYLIRTKTGAERTAHEQLKHVVERTLLPMAKTQLRQGDRTFQRINPIFPCYLFAFFSLGHSARQIRYTPGVRGIVQFGEHAATVPSWVIDELTSRCAEGPIDLSKPTLSIGAPVRVVRGPFVQFNAIFDGYCSGTDRVAVLLSVMNAERRVVMPVTMVTAAA
jgi:transcriptional antiterminator RfaH